MSTRIALHLSLYNSIMTTGLSIPVPSSCTTVQLTQYGHTYFSPYLAIHSSCLGFV